MGREGGRTPGSLGREGKTLGSCSVGAALDLMHESGPRPGQVSWRQVTAVQANVLTPRNLSVTSLLALCQSPTGKPGKEASRRPQLPRSGHLDRAGAREEREFLVLSAGRAILV